MLINRLLEGDHFFYFAVVFSVIFSIVLHELAHGWAAIYEGDRTPIETGHMTGNPMIHMGGFSIILVCVVGIGWGAMPVDPSRFRRKYSDAWVSFAGPAMNFLLAFIAITTTWVLLKNWPDQFMSPLNPVDETLSRRVINFLRLFSLFNIALGIFNLIPVPPLDGSRILADFNSGYRRWLYENPELHGGMFMMLFIVISASGRTGYGLFDVAGNILGWYWNLLPSVF